MFVCTNNYLFAGEKYEEIIEKRLKKPTNEQNKIKERKKTFTFQQNSKQCSNMTLHQSDRQSSHHEYY